MHTINRQVAGGTDCSLPFRWAADQGRVFDTFLTFTDNESWGGPVHVHQALRQYRDKVNPAAKAVVAGMTATDFTVLDTHDPLSLNVVGFDSAVPNLVADFSRGL